MNFRNSETQLKFSCFYKMRIPELVLEDLRDLMKF